MLQFLKILHIYKKNSLWLKIFNGQNTMENQEKRVRQGHLSLLTI